MIDIPNFSVFSKHRSNLSFRKSGGIVVYIKESLSKFCSIINNESDNILWIRIEGKTFSIKKHILMGTVYIPPSNSRFSSVEIFDDIENEIFNLFKENDCICLLGDFNSRVSTFRDFIDVDVCNIAENNSNFNLAVDEIDLEAIEKYGFSIERKSKDKIVNCYGKKLIDICKHCNIIILDGRSMGDQNGEFTCKQSSVVNNQTL